MEEKNETKNTQEENVKKGNGTIGVALICALIIALCGTAYWYFTKDSRKIENNEINTEIDTSAIFNVEDYPKVDCSTATIPMATGFMSNFTNTEKEKLEIKSSKTDGAYKNLISGDVDAILVVEPSEDEINAAKKAGVELVSRKVANEGFVFFTNTQNNVSDLSFEQIQKIYTGEIKNWKEVGGSDQKIIAYQRPENSGSQTGMLSLVMKGMKIMTSPKENIASSMEEIIDLVSDYKNNAGAIGYSYYYYASTMYGKDELKLLSVDGVMPSTESIQKGEYPIKTAYYVVTRKSDENNEKVMKLVNEMLSPRGQKVVAEEGYVPVE